MPIMTTQLRLLTLGSLSEALPVKRLVLQAAALTALALSLAACAPTAVGAYASNPVVATNPMGPVKVKAGATTFVAVDYPASYFEVPAADMDQAVPINFTAQEVSGNVQSIIKPVTWFTVKDDKVPAGWTVKSESVEARRIINNTTSTDRTISVRYREYVRFIFSITVPASSAGNSSILEMKANGFRKDFPLTLMVMVDAAATTASN
jgi:hypothetical protein